MDKKMVGEDSGPDSDVHEPPPESSEPPPPSSRPGGAGLAQQNGSGELTRGVVPGPPLTRWKWSPARPLMTLRPARRRRLTARAARPRRRDVPRDVRHRLVADATLEARAAGIGDVPRR